MRKVRILWLLKKEQYGKLILMFVIFIILLQGFHMVLLTKLENQSKVRKKNFVSGADGGFHSVLREETSNKSKFLISSIIKQIENPYILDSSGEYFIVPNVVSGEVNKSDNGLDVTLCLQTTANHLYHLKDLSVAWDGPISVSVLTYSKDAVFAIYTIVYLHTCIDSVRDLVSFHLVFPVIQAPAGLTTISRLNFSCNSRDYLKLDGKRENYQMVNLQYPNNILRNIAISYSKTEYILTLDIDMVPSEALRKQFVDFIKCQKSDKKASGDKVAYVVPCFESQTEVFPAKSKQKLIDDWKNHKVRPFYAEICSKCQKVTDYGKWQSSQMVDFMDVAYYVDWEDPWEPFYIAKRKSLPLYDHRFKQYGFNRISQVCELHVAGFRFAVLNNGFVVHRGFKSANKFHPKKDEEQERNRQLFREFKEGLKVRYPESKLEC